MKKIFSRLFYLTNSTSEYLDANVPLGSKILNVSIDYGVLNVLIESSDSSDMDKMSLLVFKFDSRDAPEMSTLKEYIYVGTSFDTNPQVLPKTNGNHCQFDFSLGKVNYHIFRKIGLQEKRDNLIESIIDKK